MLFLKKLLSNFLFAFIFIIILIGITTFFSYFNILNNNIIKIIKLLIPIIAIFISSFRMGKCGKKRGYLQGIYLGISFISFIFLINLLFFKSLDLKLLIYYLIILLVSAFGGMFGITKKSN